jgi:hypothetical protein
MTSWRRTVRVSRDLSHYIPDPDTRAFIGRVFRAWGVEWAAVLTEAIAEGVLIDMGSEDFYPCPEHPGVNIANRPCYRCGKAKPESESAWKYTDRGWRDEIDSNPRQMALGDKTQLSLEVRL